jgi:hypothetical protein
MTAVDATNIIVGLSTQSVIDVGVVSFFLIAPVFCSHFLKRNSFYFFIHLFVFRLGFNFIQILMNAVQ